MSFLTPLALAIFALAVAPFVAHALRQGRAKTLWFPATRLVSATASSAQRRNRLEDRSLLLLRLLLLAALALLGASPFVQCSRLSLSRAQGASMAVALVIDDSHSMRANLAGQSKFEAARDGALELLRSSRKGDAFAIVLAGQPARLLTPPTTDLDAVESALRKVTPSDRRTDLDGAIPLAKSSLGELPHNDLKVVVLSDFATRLPLSETNQQGILAPLGDLRSPFDNCAVAEATRTGRLVSASVFCTGPPASSGRRLELVDDDQEVLFSVEISSASQVELPKTAELSKRLHARLTNSDQARDVIPSDDSAPVLSDQSSLTIAVRADQSEAGIKTGQGTVVGAALRALESGARIEPVSLIPDSSSALQRFGAFVVDDPAGFTPEVSEALQHWLSRGGVALVMLGPRVDKAPLGSKFVPFVDGAASWDTSTAPGASARASGSLGELASSWKDLKPSGRVILPSADDAATLVPFEDGAPLVLRKSIGQGLALITTLPASVRLSDFALRPAFVALLDRLVHEAALRHQAAATPVGESWLLSPHAKVTGPEGEQSRVEPKGVFTPAMAGRYSIEVDGQQQVRHALLNGPEAIAQPRPLETSVTRASAGATEDQVGISREVAFLVLILGTLELLVRAFGRRRGLANKNAPASARPQGSHAL